MYVYAACYLRARNPARRGSTRIESYSRVARLYCAVCFHGKVFTRAASPPRATRAHACSHLLACLLAFDSMSRLLPYLYPPPDRLPALAAGQHARTCTLVDLIGQNIWRLGERFFAVRHMSRPTGPALTREAAGARGSPGPRRGARPARRPGCVSARRLNLELFQYCILTLCDVYAALDFCSILAKVVYHLRP